MLILSFFLLAAMYMTSVSADHNFPKPTELGPYKIGHTTMVITDTTRNPNGTPGTVGRPLLLHIWYPSNGRTGPLVQYSANNPIYDGTHPPYPQVTFSVTIPSPNGALEGIPIANGIFPLIVHSHGSGGSAIYAQLDPKETLASQGYIVVAVEHTGNNLSRIIANLLGLPNPGIGGVTTRGTIVRSQDISFAISQVLNANVAPNLSPHISTKQIGLFGYSFGGTTTMLTIAGLQSANFLPDARIKAAIAMDGTDSAGLTPADYANIKIPVMLYQDSAETITFTGQDSLNEYVFPLLVNSAPKYLADVAGVIHDPGSNQAQCDLVHRDLLQIQANPTDIVTIADLQNRFSIPVDITAECDVSIYDGINDQTFITAGIDADVALTTPLMPLRTQISLAEIDRLSKWYIVSFFNKELNNQGMYSKYLTNSQPNQQQNPLVSFAKNCNKMPDHPMDLKSGDKITFTPTTNGKNYSVNFSSGNSLLDKGTNNLNLGDDDLTKITLPFAFSMPNVGMKNTITIFSNGAIMVNDFDLTDATTLGPNGFTPGSPWELAGEFLLGGLPTISTSWNDLSPNLASPGHGIFAKIEANRIIVTWDQVPVCCTIGNATTTVQAIINQNGTIEMIFGNMANTGAEYYTKWISMIGVVSGNPQASELRTDLVDFTSLKKGIQLPSAYEQFYVGAGTCDSD